MFRQSTLCPSVSKSHELADEDTIDLLKSPSGGGRHLESRNVSINDISAKDACLNEAYQCLMSNFLGLDFANLL